MKKSVEQTRNKRLIAIAAGIGGVGLVSAASAVGVNADAGGGAQAAAPVSAQAGGNAGAHMSTSATANTNARWQAEANRGADRAGERMNEKGAENRHVPGSETEAATASSEGKRRGKR
jgi:hypothetical protein